MLFVGLVISYFYILRRYQKKMKYMLKLVFQSWRICNVYHIRKLRNNRIIGIIIKLRIVFWLFSKRLTLHRKLISMSIIFKLTDFGKKYFFYRIFGEFNIILYFVGVYMDGTIKSVDDNNLFWKYLNCYVGTTHYRYIQYKFFEWEYRNIIIPLKKWYVNKLKQKIVKKKKRIKY
jgi:hypothetical protein